MHMPAFGEKIDAPRSRLRLWLGTTRGQPDVVFNLVRDSNGLETFKYKSPIPDGADVSVRFL